MRISKPFITLFISAILFAPNKITHGCSWGWDEDEIFLRPFDQNLVNLPEYEPFYFSWHYWNGYTTPSVLDDRWENLEDWSAYFKNKFLRDDIELIFYPTSYEDFLAMDENFKSGKKITNESILSNAVYKYWKNGKDRDAFQYMLFAKSIEPNVQVPDWWDPAPPDPKLLVSFRESAVRRMQDEKDPYLKLRYCYQAMRLAHYSRDYDQCIALYDQNVDKINVNSVIKYWCLSLKAGAYWRKKQYAESSYYNSIVFDKCPSRRMYSERDFTIPDEKTWDKCLSYCKTTREKTTLWLLTGINQENSALPALRAMLALDPSSEQTELLLAREVEKLQRRTMPSRDALDGGDETYDSYARPGYADDAADILAFINKGIATNKEKTPAFWYVSGAFVSYLSNDNAASEEFSRKALAAAGTNAEMQEQIKTIQILNRVSQVTEINPRIELSLLPDLKWLSEYEQDTPKEDAYRYCMYQVAKIFLAQGQPINAELCKSQYAYSYDIYDHVTKAPIDELYAYLKDDTKNDFEKFLGEKYPYDADAMLEIKGTLYMQKYDWKDAVATFSKMEDPANSYFNLPTDPFLNRINDCHDCDFTDHPADYTKQSLAEKIIDLENQLTSNPKNKAEICNQLGNAYYNISYYGNSWMALKYYRCHSCIEFIDSDYSPDDEDEFYDCSTALSYYKKAAAASKDKEFIALNLFMAAKCEQNAYYNSKDFAYENSNGLKKGYQVSFAQLKKNYADTKFFSEVIGECGYFNYYLQH